MAPFAPRDPNRIAVAVLGAGRMGRVHVRNLGAIPNADVVVVADPNPDAADALAAALRCKCQPAAPTITRQLVGQVDVERIDPRTGQ